MDIHIAVRKPLSAQENMDQDGALLFKESGVFLEFHRWLKPSFTHGFFVKPEEEFVFSDEIDVARRATGGGIIYHGKDLSFALCFPDTHPFAHEDTMRVYDTLNRLMEQAILEVHSCAIGTESEETFSFKEPFCMAKATKFDLTVGQKKVLGSAIRRKNGRILYHCSLPLKKPGYEELAPFLKRGDGIVEKILENTYAIGSDWDLLRERIQEHVTKNG
ncbi:MAG: hypothetical protein FJZ61_04765 [Chlamydiae bacterium]|nr:hypothetical protein [Chlamydiota bacterium]